MKSARMYFALMGMFLSVIQPVNAQFEMTLNPVYGVQVRSLDVFSFNMLYNIQDEIIVHYEATITDQTGNPVVRIQSSNYVLRQGINQYFPYTINIRDISYLSGSVRDVEYRTGFLPAGSYQYCIRVICEDSEEKCLRVFSERRTVVCGQFTSENVSPLLLSFPEDEDTIDDQRPMFNWIPPMPIGTDPALRYKLELVKLRSDQTKEDAINRNRGLIDRSGIDAIFLAFPAQLDDLEKGQTYAWRVTAVLDNKTVAVSEVWQFTIDKKSEASMYIELQSSLTGDYVNISAGHDLLFTYNGAYDNEPLKYELKGPDHSVIQADVILDAELRQTAEIGSPNVMGRNLFRLKLSEKDISPGFYMLKVQDGRGKVFYLKFRIN